MQHNAKRENLICPHCWHENDPCRVEDWGWAGYVHQSEVAAKANALMKMAAAPAHDADAERG
jgi:hypothetical protein